MSLAIPVSCTHCGQTFYGPDLGSTIITDERSVASFANKLQQHIVQSHGELAEQIVVAGMEYQGMLLLSNFRSDSQGLKKNLDVSRWNVHQKTLLKRFTDEELSTWVERVAPDLVTLVEMGDTANLKANLLGMLQSIRDLLEEPNKYLGVIHRQAAAGSKRLV